MNENQIAQDDEISLFDLVRKFQAGWRYLAGGLVIGLVCAGAAIGVSKPTYNATAIVQVGQVGQVGQVASVPAELPVVAQERMKSPIFLLKVAEAVGDQEWVDDIRKGVRSSRPNIDVNVVKTAPSLLQVTASASSPELGTKMVDAAITELRKTQNALIEPTLVRLRTDLSIAEEKLKSAETDLDNLGKLVGMANVRDDRFTQLSLMTTLRLQKESDVFSQRQLIMAIKTALAPPATQSVKTVESVFASSKPVSPKKALLLALGAIGGLLAGIVLLFLTDAWRRAGQDGT